MYNDLAYELLQKAELLYGKRNTNFIINGVEIINQGKPCICYPFNDNRIVIKITEICRSNKDFAIFQIAHEVIHCLFPNPIEVVTYLEEGLAVHFSIQCSNDIFIQI